jgi:predicted GH43/DUF377 family glycosyl hydrolase
VLWRLTYLRLCLARWRNRWVSEAIPDFEDIITGNSCTLSFMLIRSSSNPILSARTDLPWASKKLYNCAAHKQDGVYTMLFRAIGDDWISRLGIAHSNDGVRFIVEDSPVFSPLELWEKGGCEDPRMVRFGDTYHVTYTAYDGITARAMIVSSDNLKAWGTRTRLFPNLSQLQRENLPLDWSKAAAIYPEKINRTYRLLFGDDQIWAASSEDLVNWKIEPEAILGARQGHFDAGYVEMGPPPIKTDRGWLVLYHGIDRMDNQRSYCLGAALFASNDPRKLLWRCEKPILSPEEPYEIVGLIDIIEGGFERLKKLRSSELQQLAQQNELPKAVFCCGAVLENESVRLYYSGGDTVICTAVVDLESVFSS